MLSQQMRGNKLSTRREGGDTELTLLPGASLVEANLGWSCERIKPKNKGSLTVRHQERTIIAGIQQRPP